MAESAPPADEELMLRAGRGDAEAFGELVRRHQGAVHGTLVRMLGTAEGAEDLAQEVFLRAWKSAPRYRPDAKFTTWLLTIARNLVGDYITSLEMAGCSITLLKADDEILGYWDAPVKTPGLRWGM